MDDCQHCAAWGRTVGLLEDAPTVACPKCGRLTWMNLGINCPAGMAVAMSAGNAFRSLARAKRQPDKSTPCLLWRGHYFNGRK